LPLTWGVTNPVAIVVKHIRYTLRGLCFIANPMATIVINSIRSVPIVGAIVPVVWAVLPVARRVIPIIL